MARRASRLSQAELARRGGTSQATISAYERGLKSPSLNVAARLLGVMGCELMLHVRIDFEQYHPEGIEPFWAPNLLWRVQTPDCFDTLHIPDLVQHTAQDEWNLKDRTDRRRAYEILILQGLPQHMIRWLDGALLVDLWESSTCPRRSARSGCRRSRLLGRASSSETCSTGTERIRRRRRTPGSVDSSRCRHRLPHAHLGVLASTRDLHPTLTALGSRRCCSASPPTPWSAKAVLSFVARAYASPRSSHCWLRV